LGDSNWFFRFGGIGGRGGGGGKAKKPAVRYDAKTATKNHRRGKREGE